MRRKRYNSKTEIILLALVVLGVGLTIAYARYASNATSTMAAQVAPWKVSINNNDIVTTNTFTLEDIEWKDNQYVADGYIAPGREGTLTLEIDPSGSKVAMQYKLEIDEAKITNDNIHISNVSASTGSVMLVSDGVYTGTIPLEEVVANTKTVLTVTIEWANTDTDTANNNDTSTGSASENIQIPIKLTASQLVE
jgi:autotransporter translocation and assembly factor TamB